MAYWKPGQPTPSSGTKKAMVEEQTSPVGRHQGTPESGSKLKNNLSKSVMSMKFMKRKDEISEEDSLQLAKRAKLVEADTWNGDHEEMDLESEQPKGIKCTEVDVFGDVVLLSGRRSYGGFNKPVERHYKDAVDKVFFDKVTSSDPRAANDEELLAQYEHLVGLPRGPNQSRRPGKSTKQHQNQKSASSSSSSSSSVAQENEKGSSRKGGFQMQRVKHA